MTDSVNAAIGASAIAALSSGSSSSSAQDAITAATKKQLTALKIDTTDIKTETEAKAAIKKAQKKLDDANAAKILETTATPDIQDTVSISKAAQIASQSL